MKPGASLVILRRNISDLKAERSKHLPEGVVAVAQSAPLPCALHVSS